jgi:hypothetical protein
MAGPWTYISLGGSIGANVGLNDVNASPGPSVTPGLFNVDLNNLGADGVSYGFNLHGDYQVNDNFLVGVFGTYEKLSDKFQLNASAGGVAITGEIPEDHRWTIGGRIGWIPRQDIMVYGLAGYVIQNNGDMTLEVPGSSFSASVAQLTRLDTGCRLGDQSHCQHCAAR